VCPSCNAKRAHVTAVHLVEQVLPHVPYRQWTLSFPHRVRWVLLKDVGLLSDILTVFLRAVFALQRRRARRQGLRGGQAGGHAVHPVLMDAIERAAVVAYKRRRVDDDVECFSDSHRLHPVTTIKGF